MARAPIARLAEFKERPLCPIALKSVANAVRADPVAVRVVALHEGAVAPVRIRAIAVVAIRTVVVRRTGNSADRSRTGVQSATDNRRTDIERGLGLGLGG